MIGQIAIVPRCDLCKHFVKYRYLCFGYCTNPSRSTCKPDPLLMECDGFEERELWWSIDEG